MTITLWCLFGVLLVPIVLAAIGGYFRGKEFDTVDNKYPRLQASQLTGIGARVYAAQENAWEAAILFTAAALTSHLTGVSPEASAPWGSRPRACCMPPSTSATRTLPARWPSLPQ